MPPRPGHHLDLYLVPRALEALPDAPAVQQILGDLGLADGPHPGPRAQQLVPGGFARVRIDRPAGVTLYANGQGGFRVRCPDTDDNVVPSFQRALMAWRQGGPRQLTCPACGRDHALEDLSYAPAAAYGRGAVVLASVQSAQPLPDGLAALEHALGPLHVIGARR